MRNSASARKKNRILLESGTNEVEFLRFHLGSNFFGINVAKVRKAIVYDSCRLSSIPSAVSGLLGNYLERGECFPIIDLKQYFSLSTLEEPAQKLILICEFNNCTMGFLIDRIIDIMRCSWEHFRPSGSSETTVGHESITGNVIYNDEITPILDVEAIIANILPNSGISKDIGKLDFTSQIGLGDKTILYCEDSPTVQRVLVKCLNELGIKKILAFPSGQEGIAFMKANNENVDLIISDIEMPQMDGLTFCKEVRSISAAQKIPFLFFSSTITQEMKDKCKLVGGTASFSKPEIQELTNFVRELFSSNQ